MTDPVLDAYLSGDDEAFVRELSLNSIAHAFRPRDEFDVDVDPESLRGKILKLNDEIDAALVTIREAMSEW